MSATVPLFREDPYLATAEATVVSAGPDGIVLDRTVFYARGGGQPGDTGAIELADGTRLVVADTVYGVDRETIVSLPEGEPPRGLAGERVTLHLDWARRHRIMRMHTALHLLSVALPHPVTGGQIGADESRLDFDIPEGGLDRDAIAEAVNAMIAGDHPVAAEWITDEELEAKPDLVKTMKVKPPRGTGRVRLVRIGEDVDLQPCGGTHVASTAEIGAVTVPKVEKKGRQNRRVRLALAD